MNSELEDLENLNPLADNIKYLKTKRLYSYHANFILPGPCEIKGNYLGTTSLPTTTEVMKDLVCSTQVSLKK